jgi:hypothetical protein
LPHRIEINIESKVTVRQIILGSKKTSSDPSGRWSVDNDAETPSSFTFSEIPLKTLHERNSKTGRKPVMSKDS